MAEKVMSEEPICNLVSNNYQFGSDFRHHDLRTFCDTLDLGQKVTHFRGYWDHFSLAALIGTISANGS
jgi:hypothetical protein